VAGTLIIVAMQSHLGAEFVEWVIVIHGTHTLG
jgi:hypothetical protein